ncbi:MAG: addiction module protein [Anaerolineae bacterium]|nr:addiction module protein [Anaerolineae bacterium]
MTIEQILQEVALMPAPTRAYIAEKILEMIDAEEQINLSPEWISLIEERVSDIDTGVVQMVKADDVMKQIWSELK